MESPSPWLVESQTDIDTKQYYLKSSFKIVGSYINDKGCPYCGQKDWFVFIRAEGYEMHWSDSDIECANRLCPMKMGPWRQCMTLKQHYEYLEGRAAKWFQYRDKERVKALQDLYLYTHQMALYMKRHNGSIPINKLKS